jgi:hypothetical protein
MQFRAEAFNIFNHANYAYPNAMIFAGNGSNYSYTDSAGATTFTSTSSRQLALKLLFYYVYWIGGLSRLKNDWLRPGACHSIARQTLSNRPA